MSEKQLLFDYKRDSLEVGEAILLLADGAREKVRVAELEGEASPALPMSLLGKEEEAGRDYWSEGGQVYFLDGYAWGLNPKLETICLGTAQAVRVAIADPALKCGDPDIDGVVNMERELKREEREQYGRRPEGTVKLRASKLRKPGNKRVRPLFSTRGFSKNIRRPKKAKKLTLHPAKQE